jgi:hypothetical protein
MVMLLLEQQAQSGQGMQVTPMQAFFAQKFLLTGF